MADYTVCKVTQCSRAVKTANYCGMHYQRLRRTGIENIETRKSAPEKRFHRMYEVVNDCWEWQGNLNGGGYGLFWHDYVGIVAHKYAYKLLIGEYDESLQLDHLCRNRKCVNPYHLEPVSASKNVQRSIPYRKSNLSCKRGHIRTKDNTRIYKNKQYTSKYCIDCSKERKNKLKNLG